MQQLAPPGNNLPPPSPAPQQQQSSPFTSTNPQGWTPHLLLQQNSNSPPAILYKGDYPTFCLTGNTKTVPQHNCTPGTFFFSHLIFQNILMLLPSIDHLIFKGVLIHSTMYPFRHNPDHASSQNHSFSHDGLFSLVDCCVSSQH